MHHHNEFIIDHKNPNIDASTNSTKTSPDSRTNILSYLLFSWQTPLLRLGSNRPLQMDDMYQMQEKMKCQHNVELLNQSWSNQIKQFISSHGYAPKPLSKQLSSKEARTLKSQTHTDVHNEPSPSLIQAICRTYKTRFFIAGIFQAIAISTQMLTPVVLQSLLAYLQDESNRLNIPEPFRQHSTYVFGYGYWLVAGIFSLQVTSSIANSAFFFTGMKIGMNLRSALMGMIYEKSMRLSSRARSDEFNAGKITNIIATDTTRLDTITPYMHNLWSSPLQVVVIMSLLIRLLGLSALAGLGIMLAYMPIQAKIMRSLSRLRRDIQLVTDKRVKLINEILQGSRIVKLMAWESAVTESVMELRMKELAMIKRLAIFRAGINGIAQAIPPLAAIVVFSIYFSVYGVLGAPVVFSALALFNQLRMPLLFVPLAINFFVDGKVAAKRIKALLLAEETSSKPDVIDQTSPTAIRIEKGQFEWVDGCATLSDINLCIPKGSLTAIVGSVGSGKSSLLSGVAGEIKQTIGTLGISGKVGYCPQQPWVQNATVKQNILFGLPYDFEKYNRALQLSALEKDLQQLPAGDNTEVGERGITLSGGQKARINFARAIYFNPDVFLLDDPLSAVDAHVGKHLFESIVCGLEGKTRILVTHALHFVPRCEYVVYMKDGKILEQGSFNQLMDMNGEFAYQMKLNGGLSSSDSTADNTVKCIDETVKVVDEPKGLDFPPTFNNTTAAPAKVLMQTEERAIGSVNLSVYRVYMNAVGSPMALSALFFLLVLYQLVRVGNDLWLTWWIRDSFNLAKEVYLGVYFSWGVAQASTLILTNMHFAFAGIRASAKLHRAAVLGVMQSPMSFFDTTPIGRIISRLSKDQDAIDSSLPDSWRLFLNTLFQTLSTFTIMIVVTPMFAGPLVPLLILYWYVQQFYRRSSREIKRLDSISRSPLYAAFSETLNGLSTIRAYNEQARFCRENRILIDANNRPQFMQFSAQRWLSIRLEFIGASLVFFAGLFGVLNISVTPVELIGLALSYALQVTGTLNWCVRQITDVETHMNAVERLNHYGTQLEKEATTATDNVPISKAWPDRGEIRFTDVTMCYRKDLDPVLKDVTFTIPAGCKIGIVGRTGAGKSSILVALFRLAELMKGRIEIDGHNISQIELHELRSRLAIIPQEPTLFAGTLRKNIDRFSEMTDARLWECVERAGLKSYVESQVLKLETPITEGGENLSVGQRQLVCLARAMVLQTNVLVMDEATAACDIDTDVFIQQAVRSEFAGKTILCIAHRLNTIIDFDMILVMDAGSVREFDSPHALLQNPRSLFSALVDETGPANAALLRRLAMSRGQADV